MVTQKVQTQKFSRHKVLNAKMLILFLFVLMLQIQTVQAICLFGIGSTCRDSSRETGIKRWFNFNEPVPSDQFDVFGIREKFQEFFEPAPTDIEDKPSSPYTTPATKPGDKVKNTDLKGEPVVTTFTEVTWVEVGAEDPWYYDLDIIQINKHQCVGCPLKYPDIPGFDYEFEISIRNTGNVPCDREFTIEIIGEDENGKLYYNEVVHRPGFPVGTGNIGIKIYDVGLINKQLDPNFIYTGVFDDEEMPLKITVRLKDDDKEVEPGFVEFEKKTRDCEEVCDDDEDNCRTSCSTITEIVRELIHAQYLDPESDDFKQYNLNIIKITSDIKGDAALDFLFG